MTDDKNKLELAQLFVRTFKKFVSEEHKVFYDNETEDYLEKIQKYMGKISSKEKQKLSKSDKKLYKRC